jgi:hypothetical protein
MAAEPSQAQVDAAVSACNDLINELPFYAKSMINNDMIYKVAYACASAVVQVGEEEAKAKLKSKPKAP